MPSASQAAPLLMSVKLPIRVLMGRTQMSLREITQLGSGSVVELDCSPDDPVELVVNDRVIAHGEIVVVGGNYGVRITRIADGSGGQVSGETDLLRLSERLR
jgi:flagellar motor switch protein FliN/FliY